MCGITGIYDPESRIILNDTVLNAMNGKLVHRGPDDRRTYLKDRLGFGFTRLSIIDLEGGIQPLCNEDETIVMICNGEIYNHKELRSELKSRGHQFRTSCDIEVIIHLYEEFGEEFINQLNGQFAFALFDQTKDKLLIARDHVGICPLFYTSVNGAIIFGSEIKSILEHPQVKKKVNLAGLDQLFTYPGLVSPTTMFEGIDSLKPGHFIRIADGQFDIKEYWDLEYPDKGHEDHVREKNWYISELENQLLKSVDYRLQADVPVGYYISGGVDSSLITGMGSALYPNEKRKSFSITFPQNDLDESRYQQVVARRNNTDHHEILFNPKDIASGIKDAIYFAEMPLKESYNTCSLALSKAVRQSDLKVVLTGEGADEVFAGYSGYKFDQFRDDLNSDLDYSELMQEQEIRENIWGDPEFQYERNYVAYEENKQAIYSDGLKAKYHEFSSLNQSVIDLKKVKNKSNISRRSYIDFKVRLADHLLSDHGDRVAYANSVEARYPFIDINVLNLARQIPDQLKLDGLQEKYILKKCAEKYVPSDILDREKFGFIGPGSPYLLREDIDWINEILSYETIKRQGYFDPDMVERLKKVYGAKDFSVHPTFEIDLLMIVLTFGIFLEVFDMPDYSA